MLRGLLFICVVAGIDLAPLTPAKATCIGVGCTCTISASALDFGTYNPVSAANLDATGNVSVTCEALAVGADISYEVTLGPGGSADQLNRSMTNGSDTLGYNLYTTSARTTVWGDGTGGTGTIVNSYLLNVLSRTDDFPVYGRTPGSQNVSTGSYSDTITATVIF